MMKRVSQYILVFLCSMLVMDATYATCSGTTTTWTGSDGVWDTAGNWSTGSIPDTSSEDVVVTASSDLYASTNTVGCVTVSAGRLRSQAGAYTLTITGSEFSAPTTDSFLVSNAHDLTIEMAGTADQTIDVADYIDLLTISNNNTVTVARPTRILDTLSFTGTTTIFKINGAGEFRTNQAVTIPAGVTVEVNDGATWYARENITVNGVLKINPGGILKIRNGRTLTVNSSGVLQVNGASGNAATIKSNGAALYYHLDVAGTLSAQYFVFNGTRNDGLHCQGGTISQLSNGEFHYGRQNSSYMTIDSGCSMPATMDEVGFYDDGAFGNLTNVEIGTYTGSSFTLNDWSGDLGGATHENDSGTYVNWGAEASTQLILTNVTASGDPGGSTTPAEGYLTYASFKVALSRADTATNITDLTVTMGGTASASDVEAVRVYQDSNDNCTYDDGVDAQIGSDLTMSGSPGTGTLSGISTGVIDTSSPTATSCFFIRAKVSDVANDEKTLSLGIQSTSDMTNDQGYSFSGASSPPIYGNTTIISNGTVSFWRGTASSVYTNNTNWIGQAPTLANARSCNIGAETTFVPQVSSATVYCLNASLLAAGTLDWNNTANTFNIVGSLTVESGFTFQNATSGPGVIHMNGSSNTYFDLAQAFPGHMIVENTGTSGSNVVSVNANSTISGDLTIREGVVTISSGITLTVTGNVVVESGGELNIEGGGTLMIGNGSTLTVDSGGTLRLVGTSGSRAEINASGTDSWSATINGNLFARYYILSHLNPTGFVVSSSATIDGTNHLQDGSFLYPLGASPKMLVLQQEIPGDQLDNMNFDDDGATYSGSVTNIDTSSIGASVDTLEIPNYSGNLSGSVYDDDPNYAINWQNETNTLKVTKEYTTPSTLDAGSSYIITSFGFQQASAGTYNSTDITQLKISLQGTATGSDIADVRAYFDSDCDESAGTLIGTGTFSGNPATITYNFTAGDVTVASHATTPPKVCVYFEADIAGGAGDGNTVRFRIASDADMVDSESYGFDGSTPTPVYSDYGSIAAATNSIWTGSTSTDWTNGANWTGGVPDKTKDCEIPSVGNNPIISSGTEICRTLNITTGTLTISSGATLEVYQNISNTGTISGTGQIRLEDDGSVGNHSINSSSAINQLTFDMAATGGTNNISFAGTSTDITNLVIPTGQNILIYITNGKTLNLSSDLNIQSGTFRIDSGGTLTFADGNSILVNGGIFQVDGVSDLDDSDPDNVTQNAANKGKVEVRGAGTWNFTANSGTVNLKGFLFDEMGDNGLHITGSTQLNQLNGGQFTSISTNYASVKVININTTGSVVSTAQRIGFQWDSVPANTESYTLVETSGNGCSSGALTFTDFFGNWYEDTATFDVETKNTDVNCTVTFGDSATAVSLSSFTAQGYNGAIDLQWETGNEEDHLGFNVYRTDSEQSSFVKVNESIILNLNNAGSHRGRYRFIDNTAVNGVIYYYYLQDININLSDETYHGPVVAVADASAGSPPSVSSDVNSSDNQSGNTSTSDPATISNPTYKDLGDGVTILSQSSSNIRIKVVPPTATFTASSWDGSYYDVAIKSYSETVAETEPKLLEREVLIEVYPYAESVELLNSTLNESTIGTYKVSPAPSYITNADNTLSAQYSLGSSYSDNNFSPSAYFDLSSELLTIGKRKFIKLTIKPIQYNPVSEVVKRLDDVVIDIGLNGNSWDQSSPSAAYKIYPAVMANNVEITYDQAGMYELSFDDLENSSVSFSMAGESTSNLRLYIGDQELALSIDDSDSIFNSGDTLRFYLPYTETLYDKYNKAILTMEDYGDGSSPLRMESIDGATTGHFDTSAEGVLKSITAEENLLFVTSERLSDNGDLFFWKMLYNSAGSDELDFTVSLPQLNNAVDDYVEVEVTLKGRPGIRGGQDIEHHVGLYVNDMTETVEEMIFTGSDRKTFKLYVDSSMFLSGNNQIRLKVFGTFAAANDYDLVYVDHVKFNYYSSLSATSDLLEFTNEEQDFNVSISDFSTNSINIFDISKPYEVKTLTNATVSGSGPYTISFNTNSVNEEELGTKYIVNTDAGFLTPQYLALTSGFNGPLHNSDNGADLIVLGHSSLQLAVDDLVTKRESEGYSVFRVELDQVFAEFSDGRASPEAINDFINYTLTSWSEAPRYLLILGDGTFDGLDHNIEAASSGERSFEYAATMPVLLGSGRHFNFASDSDLVSSSSSHMPQIAVGRLPTNSAVVLAEYVEKLLAYESGDRSPSSVRSATFIQDIDYNLPDRFQERGTNLSSLENFTQSGITTEAFHRDDYANATTFETKITEEFNTPSLWLNLWGHGAFDVWGDDYFFDTSFAQALTNTELPIVMSLSCENAYFYEDTVAEKSLGEELVFNKNGGAITFIGSTAQTTPETQDKFANSFAAEFALAASKPEGNTRLGDIYQRSLVRVGSHDSYKDIVRSMHFFGDPTMRLPASFYEEDIQVSSSAPAQSGGCSAFAGNGESYPWYIGFLEYLMTFSLIWIGRLKFFRKAFSRR